jgi:hypothetical protein
MQKIFSDYVVKEPGIHILDKEKVAHSSHDGR